jgi:5-methylcytosine-specific restriction endonuclease McrA
MSKMDRIALGYKGNRRRKRNGADPMPMQRDRYPADWEAISLRVREAAGWKCEFCGIAQGTEVIGTKGRPYKVILTVAHLGENKHDKMDCSNLKALCQACHLREDAPEHAERARKTRQEKKRQEIASRVVEPLALEL